MTQPMSRRGVVEALLVSNAVSVVLFVLRWLATGSAQYWFMFWNLFLAWVPVLCAWLLLSRLKHQAWRHPLPVLLTVLWLTFLPNSFYLMSDLIHLESTGDIGVLFDTVLFLSFIWNGIVAGLLSMVWVHKAFVRYRNRSLAVWVMAGVTLATSFAIYLGRSLRWNTWDILLHPTGILFDISERVVNPGAYPQAFVTTLSFFVLIGSMYMVVWNFLLLLNPETKR